jgi:hypothetical protein
MSTKQQQVPEPVKAKPSLVGKVLRRIAYGIGGLFLFIMVLLVSPWGTQLALSLADSSFDELEIDYTSGGLFSEALPASTNTAARQFSATG